MSADIGDLLKDGRPASRGFVFRTVKMVGDTMIEAFGAQKSRVAALEQRIAALEAKPAVLRYMGPFEQGREYVQGEFVTHRGSLWHANERTNVKPGDGAAWTLAVKAGRDGRDARESR